MSGISEAQYASYYVQSVEKQQALAVLKERIEAGEDVVKITGIRDKYYRDKVISGLCPMSALVYYRVCLERPLPKPHEKIHCLRCGAVIGENSIYCSICKDEIRVDKKKKAEDSGVARFNFGRKTRPHLSDYGG